MAPKVFITGATGYIGGDALYALIKAHPHYEYTAIVRNSDRGAPVAAAYPKIRLVYGTLDDADLIEEESAKADIVVHTADSSDHEVSARAIQKGLQAGHTAERPGYWLHVSGTGILCWKDMETKSYGQPPSQKPYDDLEGVSELTSLPDSAWHRDIDKIVLSTGSDSVKTAVLCPPTIYGPGRGPVNQRSKQVPLLAQVTLEKGEAPVIGTGLTEWDNVNVTDLSDLVVLLAEAAVAHKDDPELWNERGYFLVENGHHVWGEVSKWIAEEAYKKGYIKTTELKPLDPTKGGEQGLTWGLNSKGFARRAKKYLGWSPKGKSLKELIPDIVDVEAVKLGLKKGYAEKVASEKQ